MIKLDMIYMINLDTIPIKIFNILLTEEKEIKLFKNLPLCAVFVAHKLKTKRKKKC